MPFPANLPQAPAIRWTIGDVSDAGFEALRLSVWGAWRLFGPAADYVVCVNSLPVGVARGRTGALPGGVAWRACDDDLPAVLRDHLGPGLAEGVAWKLAPLRLFPDRFELTFDNDCILWRRPEAIERWLAEARDDVCVLAEDVVPAFGRFAALCGPRPRNTGIRGLPPGFDLAAALVAVLAEHPVQLVSELDEQGLQVAALSRRAPPLLVTAEEVTICSPFPPHVQRLGRCGAHFTGLNMKRPRPWYGQPALDRIRAHWEAQRPFLYDAVGLPLAEAEAVFP